MTTYVSIADSEIDPESPGTTSLFTKLRNNPIAITEGSSGAPAIAGAALGSDIGALIELESKTFSVEASFEFTTSLSSTYDEYVLTWDKVTPGSSTDTIELQFSDDAGSTWKTTNYKNVTANTTGVALSSVSSANASFKSKGHAVIGQLTSIDTRKPVYCISSSYTTSEAAEFFTNMGFWDGGVTALDRLRVKITGGTTITTGVFKLYGRNIG